LRSCGGVNTPHGRQANDPNRDEHPACYASAAARTRRGRAPERWTLRRGEARAAAGRRLPHTRAALVFGALAAAVAVVPSQDDTGDTSHR